MSGKHFDQAAAGWDQKQRRVELAAAIAAGIAATVPLHAGMKSLEFGCGTGLVGLALAPRLAALTAVDTSAGMLEVLTRKIDEAHITNVTPVCRDLARESLEDRYDLIFSAMTLHHIQETEELLHKLCDHLCDGGWIALADLYAEEGSFHDADAEGVMHHGFEPEALAAILTAKGLEQVSFHEVHAIRKPGKAGGEQLYPVFLLVGKKAGQ